MADRREPKATGEPPKVAQAGFLSTVILDFAAGEPSLDSAWVGRLQPNGEWEQLESALEAVNLA